MQEKRAQCDKSNCEKLFVDYSYTYILMVSNYRYYQHNDIHKFKAKTNDAWDLFKKLVILVEVVQFVVCVTESLGAVADWVETGAEVALEHVVCGG